MKSSTLKQWRFAKLVYIRKWVPETVLPGAYKFLCSYQVHGQLAFLGSLTKEKGESENMLLSVWGQEIFFCIFIFVSQVVCN